MILGAGLFWEDQRDWEINDTFMGCISQIRNAVRSKR
jgi:hypothetical protein